MPHIKLADGLPGIRGLLVYSPATAKPIGELAEVLLRGPSTLTRAERELIATHVSFRNDCHYCQSCHGAIAAEELGGARRGLRARRPGEAGRRNGTGLRPR